MISSWQNPLHGLEAVGNLWNVALGLAVFFLARCLACLYFINNIDSASIAKKSRKHLFINMIGFLVLFLPYLVYLFAKEGFTAGANGVIAIEEYKYLHNLIAMPWAAGIFLAGVLLVLFGILKTLFKKDFFKGIWFAGFGTVCVVWMLLLIAGLNQTAYYPSLVDMQSSLTISNSSSSLFTLKTMAVVSLFIPFVLAYIAYVWRILGKEKGPSAHPRDKKSRSRA